MRKIIDSITQKLKLPALCKLCNQFHKNTFAICKPCLNSIIPLGPACVHCATPLPNTDFLLCGACIKQKPMFDQVWVAYRFEEPLRSLIHEFKYHQGLYLTKTLCNLMLHALKPGEDKPECLIPVPMHPARIKLRGFNQAAVLAKQLAQQLNIPCDLDSCKKIVNTAPQASLNSKERQKNLRNVFLVNAHPYEHVALIDDLVTTGSTANEITRLLKKTGVKHVSLWCCART